MASSISIAKKFKPWFHDIFGPAAGMEETISGLTGDFMLECEYMSFIFHASACRKLR